MATYKMYVDKQGRKEPSIYEDEEGRKYLRIKAAGSKYYSYISLKTKSIAEAIKIRDARRAAKVGAKLGIAVNPEEAAKAAAVTVATVINRYQKDGYPDKKGVPRGPGKHLKAEEAYCDTLLGYFTGDGAASLLSQDDLDQYHDWRVAQVKAKNGKGNGHRTTDLELNTLNNAMRWAVRKKLLKSNPTASRARYHTATDATHCREFSVSDVDELHAVAGALMSSTRSEVLGWQLLYEGLSGLRSEEVTGLKMKARADEPGGVGGNSLCVRRADKSSRDNPYVQVNEGLQAVIAAHKIWHKARYPLSPWYFPGRDKTAGKPVRSEVLTKALDRLFKTGKLKRKFTSHGGRAFYVLARRSQGASDTQITFEINHTGGVGTLETVYGIAPPHWKDKNAAPLAWTPKGPPAWLKIKKVDFSALNPVVQSYDI